VNIRPAEQSDVDTIVRINGNYASQGLMLPRSHAALQQALTNYLVTVLI
jgi:N-acetylglutamate synthase-like GNAT family acetyltransferase